MGVAESLSRVYRELRMGRALRGYFINTLFDSTFIILGAIVSSAFNPQAHPRDTMAAMVTLALSVGMASGVSVYEAETVESEIRRGRIARALLKRVEDTEVERGARITRYATALTNFLAPFLVLGFTIIPFLLVGSVVATMTVAAYASITTAIAIIFIVGAAIGRMLKANPWLKGLRMALIGVAVYAATFYIERLAIGG